MSTIKSSAENLTLNADGANNDIIFQSNGSNIATLDQAGLLTATSFAGSGANLTGLSSFDPDGAVTINDSGADVDFRVESDDNANMLFVDGGEDRVGIGTGTPSQPFELRKDQNSDTTAQIWNDTAGTGASSALRLKTNSALGIIAVQDDGYTSSGVYQADAMSIFSASTAAGGLLLGTEGDHEISFYQNNTKVWEIDTTGGIASPSFATDGNTDGFKIDSANEYTVYYAQDGNGNRDFARYYNGDGYIGRVRWSGGSLSFENLSDYRAKENVVDITDATARLLQLKPKRYNLKSGVITLDGFLAHEVSPVCPEAVGGEKDAMTAEVLYVEGDELPDGKSIGDVKEASVPDMQMMDNSKLVPLLVKTIQEMEARITALEA
jgi:hypothetical protein